MNLTVMSPLYHPVWSRGRAIAVSFFLSIGQLLVLLSFYIRHHEPHFCPISRRIKTVRLKFTTHILKQFFFFNEGKERENLAKYHISYFQAQSRFLKFCFLLIFFPDMFSKIKDILITFEPRLKEHASYFLKKSIVIGHTIHVILCSSYFFYDDKSCILTRPS